MNANAKKWVQALRSGEYKQTICRLKDNNGYCCLGVACEIFKKENPNILIESTIFVDDLSIFIFNYRIQLLPEIVMNWLGIKSPEGIFYDGSLASLNDCGSTFLEIADKIESEPEGLFIKE